MKATAFFSSLNKGNSIESGRLVKLVVELRKLGLYPYDKNTFPTDHVTAKQAAHCVRIMAINPNPLDPKIKKKVNEYNLLVNEEDNSSFIDCLSEILGKGHGWLYGMQPVLSVTISRDRPYARIDLLSEPENGLYTGNTFIEFGKKEDTLITHSNVVLHKDQLISISNLLHHSEFDFIRDNPEQKQRDAFRDILHGYIDGN